MSTETQGTLTNTTVSVAANPSRRGVVVGNNSDTAMTVRFGAAASAAAGLPLPAGDTMWLTPEMTGTGIVSVFCAGTSKAYTIYEW